MTQTAETQPRLYTYSVKKVLYSSVSQAMCVPGYLPSTIRIILSSYPGLCLIWV